MTRLAIPFTSNTPLFATTMSTPALTRYFEQFIKRQGLYDHPIVVQVVRSKVIHKIGDPINEGHAQNNTYKLIISDGHTLISSLYSTQEDQTAYGNSAILQLNNYSVQKLPNGKFAIQIHSVTPLGYASEKIGDPIPLDQYISQQSSRQQKQPQTSANERSNSLIASSMTGNGNGNNISNNNSGSRSSYGVKSGSQEIVTPVNAINPYINKWKIRVRATNKSDIRTYTNQKGPGQLFNVTFVDNSGEIRATGFNQDVQKFYDVIKEGEAYYVSGCRVSMAKRNFSNVNNDFELMFGMETVIEPCNEPVDLPQSTFEFTKLDQLNNVEVGSTVDVVGVIRDIKPVQEIVSRSTGRPYSKRDIELIDQSGTQVQFTLWGKEATEFDEANVEKTFAAKGAKVGDFNGRNLSAIFATSISLDPDVREANVLKGWYEAAGRSADFKPLVGAGEGPAAGGMGVDRDTIEQVNDDTSMGMAADGKPLMFNIRATVTYVRSNRLFYPSCTTEGCMRKVISETDGQWHCPKCDINMPEPNYRYTMSVNVGDSTGGMWITCFNEQAESMIGKPAQEMFRLQDDNNEAYNAALNALVGQEYVFRCRAKPSTYNEQERGMNYSAVRISPVDYVTETALMLSTIRQS